MEDYIQISKLNDFIFCPRSLYFHSIYEQFDQKVYHESPQTKGKICHKRIDKGIYSTRVRFLQGINVYSHAYRLAGKIDLYDIDAMTLIERKYKINKIYDGYRYQLYAQRACLEEMGYTVLRMQIRSLKDNRKYWIPMPDEHEWRQFERLIDSINDFSLTHSNNFTQNPNKCARCIYRELCDKNNAIAS